MEDIIERLWDLRGSLGKRWARDRKPDMEIFNRALAKLELSADEVLMIGNRVSCDILGGNRAGIRSILIWHQGMDHHPDDKIAKTDEEHPITTAFSFLDLEQVIMQLIKEGA